MDDLAEHRRLDGIRALRALSDDPNPTLERIVRVAVQLTGSPSAAIHILDDAVQHRIASVGAPLGTHPREDTLCRLVVESGEGVSSPDVSQDERFAHSSFAAGPDPVRFYASAPLTADTYGVLGTLCVWDDRSREDAQQVLERLDDLAGIVIDALEARRTVELLAEAATTDELTGLPNRRSIYDVITRSLARMGRGGHPFSVAFVDLDGFKAVNDQRGHEVGDVVLRAIATNLGAAVRGDEVVGRVGGDEFVVIASDSLRRTAAVDRLRDAISTPVSVAGHDVVVGAAVGVAMAEPDDTADTLLRRADEAMYLDKRARRGSAA